MLIRPRAAPVAPSAARPGVPVPAGACHDVAVTEQMSITAGGMVVGWWVELPLDDLSFVVVRSLPLALAPPRLDHGLLVDFEVGRISHRLPPHPQQRPLHVGQGQIILDPEAHFLRRVPLILRAGQVHVLAEEAAVELH